MASTLSKAIFQAKLQPKWTLGGDNLTAQEVTADALNIDTELTSASTQAVSKAYTDYLTTDGADTIDLTSLTDPEGAALTMNSLKVKVAMFKADTTNTGDITITVGASNGYAIFGAAGIVVLEPGGMVMCSQYNTGVVVDATHKTIDISGTSGDKLRMVIVAG
jgi:hypothetical protein